MADTTQQSSFSAIVTSPSPHISPTDDFLLPLATPFVPPPECTSIWSAAVVSTSANGSSLTLTILASDAANPRFTSCQPQGWATNIPARRFSYSPAVCPSGWTYRGMEETTKINDRGHHIANIFSTAICCDRYATLPYPCSHRAILLEQPTADRPEPSTAGIPSHPPGTPSPPSPHPASAASAWTTASP